MQEHITGPYSEILQKHKNNTTQEEKPKKYKKRLKLDSLSMSTFKFASLCSLIRCFMKNAKEPFLFSCFVVGFVTTVTTKSEPRQLFSDGIGSTKSKDGIFIGTWMLFPMTSWCWYLGLQKASNEEVSAALYCHFVPKSYCTVCTIL